MLYVLDSVLQDFDAAGKVEVREHITACTFAIVGSDSFLKVTALQIGPSLPLANDKSLQELQSRLHSYLDCFTDAPFTSQRLCELLVEPHKQYTQLHKMVLPCLSGGNAFLLVISPSHNILLPVLFAEHMQFTAVLNLAYYNLLSVLMLAQGSLSPFISPSNIGTTLYSCLTSMSVGSGL